MRLCWLGLHKFHSAMLRKMGNGADATYPFICQECKHCGRVEVLLQQAIDGGVWVQEKGGITFPMVKS